MTSAFDQGFDLFKRAPDLLLAEVCRRHPIETSLEFMEGYRTARLQHDAFERERREAAK